MRSLFLLFFVVCFSVCFGVPHLELGDLASPEECGTLIENLQKLANTFSCVQDYVSSCGNAPPIGAPPTPTTTAPEPPTTAVTPPPPTQTPPPSTGPVNVGTYIPNWFVYRKFYMGVEKMGILGNQPQNPEDAEQKYVYWATSLDALAPKLTHIYYAFWDLDENCYVQDSDPDASWYGASDPPTWITPIDGACKGLMNDMMALKAKYPHLKMLISVGGWTYSKQFSQCASKSDGIAMFYRTFAYRANEMDPNWGKSNAIWNGIDFDWEFPESESGLFPNHSDNDWNNFVALINYFRTSAASEGRNAVVLSTAIGVGETLARLADKPNITEAFCGALDHVNVMSYDIHGKWDPTTGHNAPFCIDTRPGNPSMPVSVAGAIETLIAAGCSPKKIILGLPNYAPAWTLIAPGPLGNGLFVKASDVQKFVGWSTFSDSDSDLIPQGLISYWDLKEDLAKYSDFQVYSHSCPSSLGVTVPLKHVYSSTREAFASFDDEEVMSKKTAWAKARGLGGFFFWDAQQDKHGNLLDAAQSGWSGLPTQGPGGVKQCFDSRKPNYEIDPGTGSPIVKICQMTNRSITFGGANLTCNALKTATQAICGGKTSTVIGGKHGSETKCSLVCNKNWGAGDVSPWVGDTVYYICDGETILPPSGGGGGGGGANTDCNTCSKCIAIPGNSQGATTPHCEPCANGGQSWWPCNVSPPVCMCG